MKQIGPDKFAQSSVPMFDGTNHVLAWCPGEDIIFSPPEGENISVSAGDAILLVNGGLFETKSREDFNEKYKLGFSQPSLASHICPKAAGAGFSDEQLDKIAEKCGNKDYYKRRKPESQGAIRAASDSNGQKLRR